MRVWITLIVPTLYFYIKVCVWFLDLLWMVTSFNLMPAVACNTWICLKAQVCIFTLVCGCWRVQCVSFMLLCAHCTMSHSKPAVSAPCMEMCTALSVWLCFILLISFLLIYITILFKLPSCVYLFVFTVYNVGVVVVCTCHFSKLQDVSTQMRSDSDLTKYLNKETKDNCVYQSVSLHGTIICLCELLSYLCSLRQVGHRSRLWCLVLDIVTWM